MNCCLSDLPHRLDELGVGVGKEAGEFLPAAGKNRDARPSPPLQARRQPPRRRGAPDLGEVAVDDDELDGGGRAALAALLPQAAVLLEESVQGGVGEALAREVDRSPQVAAAKVLIPHVQDDDRAGAAGVVARRWR